MNMMVKDNIAGETYKKFIEYAQKKCDAVMFLSNKEGFHEDELHELEKNMNEMKKRLKNSFITSRHTLEWGCRKKIYDPQYDNDKLEDALDLYEIFFYKFTDEVKEYLLSNPDMNSWLNPKYPEDMGFFKDGYAFMLSVTHEEMCDICCKTEEEYEYLKSIGIEFIQDHYEPFDPEYHLIHEEY